MTPLRVFISYATQDLAAAEELAKFLTGLGVETWYASSSIRQGTDWEREIRNAIQHGDWLVLLVSKASRASPWVRAEVQEFIDRHAVLSESSTRHVLSLCLDETRPESLYLPLRLVQHLDYSSRVRAAAKQKILEQLATTSEAPVAVAAVAAKRRSKWAIAAVSAMVVAVTIVAALTTWRSGASSDGGAPVPAATLDTLVAAAVQQTPPSAKHLPAVFALDVIPTLASITIDDPHVIVQGTGRSRQIEIPLDDGQKRTVRLRVTCDDYIAAEQTLTATPGASDSISLRLKSIPRPEPATLTVELDPPDAIIKLKDEVAKLSGSGSRRTIVVPVGETAVPIEFSVSHAGFVSSTRKATLDAGESRTVAVHLEREPTSSQASPPKTMPAVVNRDTGHRESVQRESVQRDLASASTRLALPVPQTTGESTTNSLGMKLTLVPAGEFEMGNDETILKLFASGFLFPGTVNVDDEQPIHRVRITKPFFFGTQEVREQDFAAFVAATKYKTDAEKDVRGAWGWSGRSGQEFKQGPEFSWRNWGVKPSPQSPVVNVSWNDATAFCNWLSEKEGKKYRLPTEAEWEYSCRAGSNGRFSFGNNPEQLAEVGNVADGTGKAKFPWWTYTINSRDGFELAAPVGRFKPNEFGLYDMHGNVYEWCADFYDGKYYTNSPPDDPQGPADGEFRILRGGGWNSTSVLCRAAYRTARPATLCNVYIGFRVACEK